ncbi:HNH endonuclease with NUMOD4 motif and intron encoded nuclease repeat [Fadolivirus algeromassiliense]|jgi:hypothetical protein|uniref:HNH endonuclease with NUMOD4 motif and intron encoded nuclease repeat n=1 Tax=Fadolivirus FV1/VV64 TaxID=3070911 RepID=A0A7D3V5V3_9VIRU|nr:HNH endonuclease with NUMOD4 motif and intron encoded nuclease repeat [Fadolivirus algeromassiliense]QKF94352.1 HNH endonuclease with NUMOD4 motif and intron encoded nuclease repeat [Fadolivirus FV1/VV64]
MNEEWKKIPGFSNYSVSNKGKVRNDKDDYVFSTVKKNNQYNFVNIKNNNNKRRLMPVHKLVALAFIENPNNYTIVNHKNGLKNDNNLENLEWTTPKGNVDHAIKNNLIKRIGCPRQVQKLDKNGNKLDAYKSIKEAEESLGINRSHILDVCMGKRKSAHGFRWEFIKEIDDNITRRWKCINIIGLENYEISSDGFIKSLVTNRILKPFKAPNGYLRVCLKKNKKSVNYFIHRLVAITFLYESYKPHLQVNHKDKNKSNNYYMNLEWISSKENIIHSYVNGRLGKSHKRILYQLDINNTLINVHYGLYETCKKLNLTVSEVTKSIKTGKIYKEYVWKFKII